MKKNIKKNKVFLNRPQVTSFLLLIFFLTVYFVGVDLVQAFDYQLLEPLPGIGTGGKVSNFGVYLSNLYKLSISLAAVLAILQISFAGFKYLTAESFGQKTDAKSKIQNSLIGLVLILTSYLILNTINPDLIKAGFGIPSVTVTPYKSDDSPAYKLKLTPEEQRMADAEKKGAVERQEKDKEYINSATTEEEKRERFQELYLD